MEKLMSLIFLAVLVWMIFGGLMSVPVSHLCGQLGFAGGAVDSVYSPYCYAKGSRQHIPLGGLIRR